MYISYLVFLTYNTMSITTFDWTKKFITWTFQNWVHLTIYVCSYVHINCNQATGGNYGLFFAKFCMELGYESEFKPIVGEMIAQYKGEETEDIILCWFYNGSIAYNYRSIEVKFYTGFQFRTAHKSIFFLDRHRLIFSGWNDP